MDRTDDDILKAVADFLQALEESGLRLAAAYLYGSRAKGLARPDSDIDVALVSETLSDNWLENEERVIQALLKSDVRIEPVHFRAEDFRDENPLVWEIKRTGISLI